jgi:hypothetical protein
MTPVATNPRLGPWRNGVEEPATESHADRERIDDPD